MSASAGSQTEQHLLTVFLSESADQNRYFFYAKVARKEGYNALAAAFEETALQERSHAKNFLKHLEDGELTLTATFRKGQLTGNLENLKRAIAQETQQAESLYPMYAEVAKQEGFPKIATLFASIAVAERYHAARFQSFLDAIENETVFKSEEKVLWVCAKCGYVHEGNKPPEMCPACGHPKAYFQRTDVGLTGR